MSEREALSAASAAGDGSVTLGAQVEAKEARTKPRGREGEERGSERRTRGEREHGDPRRRLITWRRSSAEASHTACCGTTPSRAAGAGERAIGDGDRRRGGHQAEAGGAGRGGQEAQEARA